MDPRDPYEFSDEENPFGTPYHSNIPPTEQQEQTNGANRPNVSCPADERLVCRHSLQHAGELGILR